MRRLAMGVGAFESPDLGAPSRYLKYMLLNSRKIFRGLWSRRIHWKMRKSQIKLCPDRNLIWDFLIFQWILRLQRPLKFFLELKSVCLRYLEGAPRSGLSNASTPVAIRRIDQKRICRFSIFVEKKTLWDTFWNLTSENHYGTPVWW